MSDDKEQQIKELKAKAYDLILVIEKAQAELREVNAAIVKLSHDPVA